ncbi:hypothetical protein FSP39_001702 [Pinctada imbricata]|uniref:Uncharacterized protein n=1 Tax=Pinctada imbricata TaxID=66713 RepID=A0AA88XPC0_PINIB|nr:hypothetical protein FSP39_001702 [Pinctada imbricata]
MRKNERADRDTQLIIDVYRQEAREYRSEANRLQSILKHTNLTLDSLSKPGVANIRTLATLALHLQTKDASDSRSLDMFRREEEEQITGTTKKAKELGFVHQKSEEYRDKIKRMEGMLLTVCIIWLELVPGELRSRIGLLVALAWTVSVTTVTPFAYFLSPFGWRGIQLGLALYSAIAILEIIFLDESLRWLIAHNRVSAATNLVKRVARLNKVSFSQVQPYCDVKGLVVKSEKEKELLDKDKDSLVESKAVTTKTILKAWKEIFKDSHLRINAFVIWTVWIVNNLTYYGLVSVTPSLSGDLYINFFFGCLAEMVGLILIYISLCCLETKKKNISLKKLIYLKVSMFFSDKITNILTIVFTSVARGTIAGAFNAVYVFTPELFPTNLRNAGLGMASGLGRLAGMLAPFCDYMVDVGLWMPGVVFGILCLLGTLSLIVISETKERQLAQSVNEMKKWSEKDKTASIDSLDNLRTIK